MLGFECRVRVRVLIKLELRVSVLGMFNLCSSWNV